jgi:hypothetical protein
MRPLLFVAVIALLVGCSDPNRPVIDAIDAGDLRRAAALLGDDDIATFLRGNIAFHHAAQAERQANTAAAEPFAFDVAIRYAESARDHWIDAAQSRDVWPAANRNIERALALIADLRRKKDEAIQKQRKESQAQPAAQPEARPKSEPAPDASPKTTDEEAPIATTTKALSPEDVRNLLQQLSRKDREKREMRQKEQAATSGSVERDW